MRFIHVFRNPSLREKSIKTVFSSIIHNGKKNATSRTFSTSKGIRCSNVAGTDIQSSLYIRHDDNKNVAVVDIDLDLDRRLRDPEELFLNVKLRNLDKRIDVADLVSTYKRYSDSKEEETYLEQERLRVASEMKHLVKNKNKEEGHDQLKRTLITEGKEIREKIKSVQTQLWDLEAEVMSQSLRLPAEILPSTVRYNQVTCNHEPKTDNTEAGIYYQDIDKYVQFSSASPGCCYLHGPLAKLELELSDVVRRKLRQAGLVQFACPDMVKTVAMEGCGEDILNPQHAFQLEPKAADIEAFVERGGDASNMQKWDIMLYLCGGSSLPAFASYLCKSNISRSCLPLKWFSIGRHYAPGKITESNGFKSLLDLSQSTQVSLFGASDEQEKMESLYDEYISLMWNLYKIFDIPIRMVNVGASRLARSEGARTDVEAWVPSKQKYIQLASVAYNGQYISRRLMIKSSSDLNDIYNKDYLYMVYGTALNTPGLMHAILEHGSFQWRSIMNGQNRIK